MATDPAPVPRRLWQLPTFLVGLGAIVAMWYLGDRIRPSVTERYEKAMIALRPAVDRWPPDPDQVRAALRKIPDVDPPADMVPRVKYLTGSAYVALAEAVPDSEAAELWAKDAPGPRSGRRLRSAASRPKEAALSPGPGLVSHERRSDSHNRVPHQVRWHWR